MKYVFAFVIALLTGILTGAGIGGGTLLVLWLSFMGVPAPLARSTNLLYFIASAPLALYHHIKNKLIDIGPALLAALTGSLCAALVVWLTRDFDPGLLKKAFGLLFVLVGIREIMVKKKK